MNFTENHYFAVLNFTESRIIVILNFTDIPKRCIFVAFNFRPLYMTQRIFKRKIYDRMLEWKNIRAGSTALLIKGARRIGKSTIARLFAQNEYESYIEIDFARASDEIKELFGQTDDLDYLFLRLQAIYHVSLQERRSVIIFDEVQMYPKARQAIKYLVEDGRYDYIETGSLLSIRKNTTDILIPSEETRLSMYPLDYEEFLWAIGDEQTFPLIKYSYEKLRPLGDDVNRRLMRQFRLYMLVGGMPQAVNSYLGTNDLVKVDAVKREILELYIDDLRKIDRSGRASRIFESLPGELSRGKLRYNVGSVIANAQPTAMDSIWKDLEDSLTVNFCYRCTDPNVGMGLHRDSYYFKLYVADTGLFVTLAFLDRDVADNTIYRKLLADKLGVDVGYIFENAVAQCLRSSGHSLFYHTMPADEAGKNNYEIDFVISRGDKIVPVEVKSGGYMTHKSIDVFAEKYSGRISRPVMLYTKDLRKDGQMLYLPVYFAPLL